MKLLIVFFGNDYHGGTSYSTATIAKELVRRGHEVHAFVRKVPAGRLAADLESYGVTVLYGRAPIMVKPLEERRPTYKVMRFGLELGRRFYSLPTSERLIDRIVRTGGYDLVALSSGAIITGARAAQKAGIPYVWHRREFMEEDFGLEYYPWVHEQGYLKDAARLICVSQAVEQKMLRICPEAKTSVVYNGIDQDIFYPAAVPPSSEGPVKLMYSGGIKHSKGMFVILDALAQLDPSLDWTLDVFGREGDGIGETARDLAAHCDKMGYGARVTYRGMVTNIADEYRSHDIDIVASRAEAFGRVTAEAMLCGCAVVGSNSGGTPELISGQRGYLFEPHDATSLAQAITEAASDPADRAARTERALSYARENFSVNSYIDGIEAVYQSVVS